MATKKEKRERALAKRAQFEADVKASGLAALEYDRQRQKREQESLLRLADRMNERHADILDSASDADVERAKRFSEAFITGKE